MARLCPEQKRRGFVVVPRMPARALKTSLWEKTAQSLVSPYPASGAGWATEGYNALWMERRQSETIARDRGDVVPILANVRRACDAERPGRINVMTKLRCRAVSALEKLRVKWDIEEDVTKPRWLRGTTITLECIASTANLLRLPASWRWCVEINFADFPFTPFHRSWRLSR